MNNRMNEIFGIHRTTLLVLAFAITFGSFSVYKALGGGTSAVGWTERSEAPVVADSTSGTALTADEDVAVTNTNPLAIATRTKNAAHPAVKTDLTPIEQIQVGDRVLAESPTGEEDTTFGSEIIPSDWRKLTLRAPKRDGTTAEVVLLRPLTWLNEQRTGRSRLPSGTFAARRTNARHLSDELGTDAGTTNALNSRDTSRNPARQAGPTVESQTVEDMVGGTVFISVPECGIDGNAEVLAIDPCPEIPSGAGRVVTGTFRQQASSTITLTIAGQSEPIECTGNHPFWSEDRQSFVRADSLQPNETLRTATGLTTVESWTADLSPTPVYNIEVHGAHVYHVGTSGVVVHNPSGLSIANPCLYPEIPELGLGFTDNLDRFKKQFPGILDYDDLGLNPYSKFFPKQLESLMDGAGVIRFDVSGMRGLTGPDGVLTGPAFLNSLGSTNWELRTIFDNPALRAKTLIYNNGVLSSFEELLRMR